MNNVCKFGQILETRIRNGKERCDAVLLIRATSEKAKLLLCLAMYMVLTGLKRKVNGWSFRPALT